jgi:hypothetical protein
MILPDSHQKGYFFDLDGKGMRGIIFPDAVTAELSPDGRKLAYVTGEFDYEGNVSEGGVMLHIQDIWTGTTKVIVNLVPDDLKANREKLLAELSPLFPRDDYNPGLDLMNAYMLLEAGMKNLSWSPDGRYLAFVAVGDKASSDIFIYDVNLGRVRPLVKDIYDSLRVEWSPDGKWILYWDAVPTYVGWPTSLRTIRVDGSSNKNLSDFTSFPNQNFRWISDTEFVQYKIMCFDACNGGDEISLVNVVNGSRTKVWNTRFLDAAIDPTNRTILIVNDDPCNGEDCDDSRTGMFLGPLTGNIAKISDQITDQVFYRGGESHSFVGASTTGEIGINRKGILEDIHLQTRDDARDNKISLSPDSHWFILYDRYGYVLFDESDQVKSSSQNTPVYAVAWPPDSLGLYILSDPAVYYLSFNDPTPRQMFDCKGDMCGYSSIMEWIPGGHLPSKPWLSILPTSKNSPAEGKSFWSLTKFQELEAPGTNTDSVEIPAISSWRWEFSWCALSESGLQDILDPMDLHFAVDGTDIGTGIFRIYDHSSGGWYCRTWAAMLSGWQAGDQADLEIQYSLSEAVNDGKADFPAGEYRQILHVTVK